MNESIFFYSKFCPYSKKCYELMADKGLDRNFKYVSVDKDPSTKRRDPIVEQYGLKSVPAVFMGSRLISGKELFTFISQWGNKNDKKAVGQTQSKPKEIEGFDSFSGFASVHSDNLINPPKDSGDTVQKVGSLKISGRLLEDGEEMVINQKTQDKQSDLDKRFKELMEQRSVKNTVV